MVTIHVNALPVIDADYAGETCKGKNDAYINLTFSAGTAPFTESQLWDQGNFGQHQRIQLDTHPNYCDIARYTVDRLWISGSPGMKLLINGIVTGEYTSAPDPHGYIIRQPVNIGDEICVENVGPEGFMILLGPDLYFHYDTYCFRTDQC